MDALNLTHSPEKLNFWECADPLITGAGKNGRCVKDECRPTPGVADSIKHDNDFVQGGKSPMDILGWLIQ